MSGHDHHHHHHHPINSQSRNLWITIAINIAITAILLVGGVWAGSLSVISDAMHNLSDVCALFITFFAVRMARKETTPEKTFGYQRAEIIAALVNTGTLFAIAAMIAFEAIERIFKSTALDGQTVMYLAVSSIIANGVSVAILHKDAKSSLNIRSAYIHLLSDALSSVAVLAGGFIMWMWKIYWIDSLLAIGIACYLVYSSWELMLESLKILMQFTPAHIDLDKLQKEISDFPQILNIHHVHIWQLNDKNVHFEAHIDFCENITLKETVEVLQQIESTLHCKYGINHIILQPEYNVSDSKLLVAKHCI